jgi:hypothetical protein
MTKIIATMATFPGRSAVVEQAVASMVDQVDRLNLVLNEYREIPAWTRSYPSLNAIIPEFDTKDTGKFLVPVADRDWLFTLDDDILYPSDYVDKSLDSFKMIKEPNVIAGYHGAVYRKPRFMPSNRQIRQLLRLDPNYIVTCVNRYNFFEKLEHAYIVEELGTGTTFARGQDIPPYSELQTAQRFVDVRLALWAHEGKRKLVCLPHPAGWMKLIGEPEITSISGSFTITRPERVAREIEKFAFRIKGAGRPIAN